MSVTFYVTSNGDDGIDTSLAVRIQKNTLVILFIDSRSETDLIKYGRVIGLPD